MRAVNDRKSSALGSARASRACFGASPKRTLSTVNPAAKEEEVRDDEGVIASTRGRVRSPDVTKELSMAPPAFMDFGAAGRASLYRGANLFRSVSSLEKCEPRQ